MRDKEILEKDKEKKREQWKGLMRKVEDEFMGEIATIGYERQRREEIDEQRIEDKKKNQEDA